ncbi:MAG: ABC transporter substrate-binding protein [Verrucomicrobiales bacterium]|nr:ABC transporter substrate-binding protein [Verrucomicrobiales bacterium]
MKIHHPVYRIASLIAGIVFTLFLSSCSGPPQEPEKETPAPEEPAKEAPAETNKAEEPAPAPAEIPTVKVSLFSWPGYGFWFIAKEKNLVPEINLDIQIIEDPYESFGQMAAGKLDVTSSTVEYGPIAAEEGVPVKMVAFTNPSYGTDKIILAPGVTDAKQLIGKEVAVLEGGLTQIYMGIWLEENGVAFDKVKYTNLIMDDAVAAMVSGKVAAGEFWEPFGSNVLKALPEATVAATSKDPYFKKTALLADGMYMSGSFLEKGEVASLAVKAYFEAVKFWEANPAEGNEIIAKGLQFPVADVELVIGADGSSGDGGIYPFNWTESSQFMGLSEGDPPFGKSGEIRNHWKLTNEWWVKFGVVKGTHPMEAGIDLSPMKILKESGYGE